MATSKPKIDYTYNSKKETAAQYNARIAKARGDKTPTTSAGAVKPTETVAQTMAKSKAMLAQTKAEGGKAFAGSAYDKPISSTTLTPVAPVTLTQPQQPLQTTGMLGEFQQASDTYNQNLQNKQAIALSQKDTAATAYKDFLGQLQGQTGLEDTAYSQKGGVDSVQKELDDINNQILQEQRSLQNKLDKLEQNAQGMFAGALEDQMYDVERESLKKQADLSIIQMGIQGRYDSAKNVADRAVSAYLEKQRIIGETLKFNYEENRDAFTLAEQRAFESAQKDRDRALAKEESDRTAIYNMAIQAQQDGAPLSTVNRILSAKTLGGAIGVGWSKPVSVTTSSGWELKDVNGVSSWVNKYTQEVKPVEGGGTDGTNLKPVKDLEIRDLNDTWTAKNSIVSIVDQMTKSIADNGTKIFWGSEAGKRGANKTNLLLAMKNLEKTGALDKGTIDVLADLIPENEFWATEDRQIAALNQLKDTIINKTDEFVGSYRGTTAETDPRTSRIYKSGIDTSLFDLTDMNDLDSLFGTNTTTSAFNPASFY